MTWQWQEPSFQVLARWDMEPTCPLSLHQHYFSSNICHNQCHHVHGQKVKYLVLDIPRIINSISNSTKPDFLIYICTSSGGQDPSPTFLNEQSDVNGSINGGVGNNINGSTAANTGGIKKDSADLIIGSWNDEDTEKVLLQTH